VIDDDYSLLIDLDTDTLAVIITTVVKQLLMHTTTTTTTTTTTVGSIASQSSLIICNDNEYIGALLSFAQEINRYATDRACEVSLFSMCLSI
jgi:hypothetical protein